MSLSKKFSHIDMGRRLEQDSRILIVDLKDSHIWHEHEILGDEYGVHGLIFDLELSEEQLQKCTNVILNVLDGNIAAANDNSICSSGGEHSVCVDLYKGFSEVSGPENFKRPSGVVDLMQGMHIQASHMGCLKEFDRVFEAVRAVQEAQGGEGYHVATNVRTNYFWPPQYHGHDGAVLTLSGPGTIITTAPIEKKADVNSRLGNIADENGYLIPKGQALIFDDKILHRSPRRDERSAKSEARVNLVL